MSSYSGVHVESADQAAIADAIERFEREARKRKTARAALEHPGMLRRGFCIGPAVDRWTEIILSFNPWRDSGIALDLSKRLACRVAACGYQTTAGLSYYRLCERGKCVRSLWYTSGETIHEEEGEPLDFERKIIEQKKRETPESELAEEIDNWAGMSASARSTFYLPGCEEFAEGLGCTSFRERNWQAVHDSPKGLCIRSTVRWWPLG